MLFWLILVIGLFACNKYLSSEISIIMTAARGTSFWFNCFLLMLPPMLWNIVLTDKLPEVYQPDVFQRGIPYIVLMGEQVSRIVLFVLSLLMPLSASTIRQKRGWVLYITGILTYFISWLLLMYRQDSAWSNSIAGFMAPAYTPLLWLGGIWLIGERFYFKLPFSRWIFLLVVIVFLAFHNVHTYMVWSRVM